MNIRKWLRNDSLIAPADGTGINFTLLNSLKKTACPVEFGRLFKRGAAYLSGLANKIEIKILQRTQRIQ